MATDAGTNAYLIHTGSKPTASIPDKVVLNKPAFKIGRMKDQVDIFLTSATKAQAQISRHHATILQEGDAWRVVDNQSANGLFVNGTKATDHLLVDGDEIVFGVLAKDTEFKYKYVAGKPGTAKSVGLALPLPQHTRQGLALGTWKGPDQMAMTFKRLRNDTILRDTKSTMASGGLQQALMSALAQLEERQKDLELASDLGMMLLNKNQEMNEEMQELRPQLERLQEFEQKYIDTAASFQRLDEAHVLLVDKCRRAEFARDEYHTEVERLQDAMARLELEKQRLVEEAASANKRGDEYMSECNELRAAVDEYKARETSLAKREAHLKEQKAATDDKLAELQAETERIQMEAHQKALHKQAVSGPSRELEQLRTELAAVLSEKDAVAAQLSQISKEANVLREEKGQHSAMLAKSRTEIATLKDQIEELQMEAQLAQPAGLTMDLQEELMSRKASAAGVVTELQVQVASLRAQLQETEANAQQARSSLTAAESDVRQLNSKLSAAVAELQSARTASASAAETEQLQSKLEAVQKSLDATTAAKQALQVELESERVQAASKLSAVTAELESRGAARDDGVQTLRAELSEVKSQLQNALAVNEVAESAKSILTGDNATLKQQLEKALAEVSKLQSDSDDKEQLLSKLTDTERQVQDMQKSVDALSAEKQALYSQVQKLQSQEVAVPVAAVAVAVDVAAPALEAEKQELAGKLAAATEELQKLKATTSGDASALQGKLADAEQVKRTLQSQVQSLQAASKTAEDEKVMLQTSLAQTKNTLTQDNVQLKQRLDKATQDLLLAQAATTDLQSLRYQLEQASMANSAMQMQLSASAAEKQYIVDEAQQRLAQANADVVAVRKQFEEATVASQNALAQCSTLREQLLALQSSATTLGDIQPVVAAGDEEPEQLRKQIADLQAQIHTLKTTIDQLQREDADHHTPLIQRGAAEEPKKEESCCSVM
eukprot:TRINITY_DN10700_c0_g1_i1.p1 TRINITY_DN10700_c0_g1~~TRINITY_DN10700_c0_g1_i1.p1  ORF type:complete len:955 (+),score=336.33 TRINITY_DN10700_c0_g1_i1:72-2936(+)